MTEAEYAGLKAGDKVWLDADLFRLKPGTIVPSPNLWPPACCKWAVLVKSRSYEFRYMPPDVGEFLRNVELVIKED